MPVHALRLILALVHTQGMPSLSNRDMHAAPSMHQAWLGPASCMYRYVQGPRSLMLVVLTCLVVCEGSIIVRRRALSNGAPQVWICVLFSFFVFFLLLLFFSSPTAGCSFLDSRCAAAVSLRSLRAKKNFASGLVRRVDSQVVRTRRRSPKSHESLTKP